MLASSDRNYYASVTGTADLIHRVEQDRLRYRLLVPQRGTDPKSCCTVERRFIREAESLSAANRSRVSNVACRSEPRRHRRVSQRPRNVFLPRPGALVLSGYFASDP
jgi:hypothetical protein